MKRNEYEKVELPNSADYEWYRSGKEFAYDYAYIGRVIFWRNADIRWFNVFDFKLGNVKLGSDSYIIGDE